MCKYSPSFFFGNKKNLNAVGGVQALMVEKSFDARGMAYILSSPVCA